MLQGKLSFSSTRKRLLFLCYYGFNLQNEIEKLKKAVKEQERLAAELQKQLDKEVGTTCIGRMFLY